MFRGIKLKLGLTKYTNDEVVNILYGFHNEIAKQVMHNEICDKNKVNEQRAEVLMFFWLTGGVPFLFNCKNQRFKNILDNNIFDILFGKLKDDYEKNVFDDIYKSRRGIYNNMLKPNVPSMVFQDYLRLTNKLLFEKPFEEVSEAEELKIDLSFDFIGSSIKNIYISSIIKDVIPMYVGALKRLSKMT
jgi:hypothetical protein